MDSMGLWLVIGAAVAIAGICVILLQKKAGEAKKYLDELDSLRNQLAESSQEKGTTAGDMQRKLDGLSATLQSVKDQNSQLNKDLTEAKEKLHLAEEEKSARVAELAEVTKKLEETSGTGSDTEDQSRVIASLKEELEEKTQELAQVSKKLEETSGTGSDTEDQSRVIASLKEELEEKTQELTELNKKLEQTSGTGSDTEDQSQVIASLKEELEEKIQELTNVEKRFEEQLDEVVQSSIQKITHAEQAKEEAIQAAQDNFEAAAEANTRLKEKEALIQQLQES